MSETKNKKTKKAERSKPSQDSKGEKLVESLDNAAYSETPPKNDDSTREYMKELSKSKGHDEADHSLTETKSLYQINDDVDTQADNSSSEAERAEITSNNEGNADLQGKNDDSKPADCGCDGNSICGCNDCITGNNEDGCDCKEDSGCLDASENSGDAPTASEESVSPQDYENKSGESYEHGQAYSSKPYSDVYADASASQKPIDETLADTLFGSTDSSNEQKREVSDYASEVKPPIDANAANGSTNSTKGSTNNGTSYHQSHTSSRKTDGSSIILWVMLIGVAAILVALALGSGSSLSNATATLKCNGNCRIGQTAVFTAELSESTSKFKSDTAVVWTVNGKQAKKVKLSEKDALKFEYTPEAKGEVTIGVKVGDYTNLNKSQKITVKNPLITVKMNDQTMIYGEKVPDFTYSATGFLNSDTQSSVKLKITPTTPENKLNVGKYQIEATAEELENYDIEVQPGTLEVQPRKITLASCISKVYDGTTECGDCLSSMKLNNLAEGDSISVSAKIVFKDAKVGESKALSVSSVKLTGKNSENYVLDTTSLTGTITPKTLTLSELIAADKIYDGTTNVTFNSVGNLQGIVSGDRVAIGEISAHFESAAPDTDKAVIITEIKLIGDDSSNYTIDNSLSVSASIIPLSQSSPNRRKALPPKLKLQQLG